jgi:hypothetical protein
MINGLIAKRSFFFTIIEKPVFIRNASNNQYDVKHTFRRVFCLNKFVERYCQSDQILAGW